ncbi:MAG: Type secretion system protein VirB10 [Phenylobacterium sp.]|nr:Type secretion system protein VirB10 [Phenylobacterium sp.]
MTKPDVDDPAGGRLAPPASVERTISPIAGRLGTGRAGPAVALAALITGCGVFVAATWRGDKPRAEAEPSQPARQVVAFEPLPAAVPTLAAPGPNPPSLGADSPGEAQVPVLKPPGGARAAGAPDQAQARTTLAMERAAPLIAYSHEGAPGAGRESDTQVVPAIEGGAAPQGTELDQLRRSSTLGRSRATRLPDRNFLILAGAQIPCILQTAMDTATPGYVSCLIPRDVLSDNGAVVLMEKGTRVLGEYRGGLRQGQSRLFVLWTRAVTPAGVAIRLDSPAADPLGRTGFDGALDIHFWDRFGGALLLSIVGDGAYAVAGGNTPNNSARVPSDAAAVALQGTVGIPPSLRKAQGAQVSIFVAQDFDFSDVYGLEAR